MTITSLSFFAFNIVAVILFIVFPKRFRWIALLISSLVFYYIVSSSKLMVPFVVITSAITFFSAKAIFLVSNKLTAALNGEGLDKEYKKLLKKSAKNKRFAILFATLAVNIGILIVFKIFNFYSDAYFKLVGMITGKESFELTTFVLPLGISYYTFAITGYLLDIYWKRYEPENNPFRFLLFAIYYPHIMQGPISRYTKLGKELRKPELHFTWDNFVIGMESIMLGCFKKLVIADRAGIFVKATLNTPDLKGNIYFLGLMLDAIQIYADFSGYMDIVSGISKMFDVELEQNFNHPFLADSVPDFWRRWHMSLGGWFKDYVYYPISVSKLIKSINLKTKSWKHKYVKTIVTVIIPVMVTWILTGLWHGSGAGYVAWGIYYGTLITLSVTFLDDFRKVIRKLHIDTECFSYKVFKTVKIFFVFMGGRFLGNTMSMQQRRLIIRSVSDFMGFNFLDYGLTPLDFGIIVIGVLIFIAMGVIESKINLFEWFKKQNCVFRYLVLYLLFFAILLFGIYGNLYDSSTFMYQQY